MISSFFMTLISLIPLVLAITLHEAAHGFVALKCGDDTARRMGRLTLNPIKHVDPVGTLLLPLTLLFLNTPFLFGYAKPIPVDFQRLLKPRQDMVWVALAGLGMNILLAIVSLFFLKIFKGTSPILALNLLMTSFLININLAVLNMIPLPPLDGGRVAVGLLPLAWSCSLAQLEPYGFFILTGLLFLPGLVGINPNPFMVFLQSISRGLAKILAALMGM